jgi:DNA segregation ATPase FtsK/SpoIIIE-like protein
MDKLIFNALIAAASVLAAWSSFLLFQDPLWALAFCLNIVFSGVSAVWMYAQWDERRRGLSVHGVEEGFDDPLLSEARAEVRRAGSASASLIQRRLKVGYARAARIIDLLEEEGLIGPGEGAKPREVLGK